MIKTLFTMAVVKVKIWRLEGQMQGKPQQCIVFECTDRAQFVVAYECANPTPDNVLHVEQYQMPVCGTHRINWPYRWATVVRTSRLEG